MSSIVERLTEGVVNRDMRAESHALLSKWKKTGLLEGLEDERQQNSMARLLENQAKELLRESTTMASGDVEGFAAVAFPIVRRVFAGLIANDLVSVQPMSLPSGLIFFLDFTFSGDLGGVGSQSNRLGNLSGSSIYGTNRVGSQVTGGVDLVGALGSDLSGPRTASAPVTLTLAQLVHWRLLPGLLDIDGVPLTFCFRVRLRSLSQILPDSYLWYRRTLMLHVKHFAWHADFGPFSSVPTPTTAPVDVPDPSGSHRSWR